MDIAHRRILIVDDSRFSRWTLKQELEQYGAVTSEAANADDALQSIRKERPDAVILDLLMPGTSGVEMLERLHAQEGNHPPIIVVTADIQKSTLEKCRELGARHFLKKPVNPGELRTALEGLFHDIPE